MRLLCLLFLAAFVGAVGLFIYQNQQDVTLRLFDWPGPRPPVSNGVGPPVVVAE